MAFYRLKKKKNQSSCQTIYSPQLQSLIHCHHHFSLLALWKQSTSISGHDRQQKCCLLSNVFHFEYIRNLFKKVPWVASDPTLSVLFIFDSGSSAAVSVCFLFFWTSRCGFTCYSQQNQFALTNTFSDNNIWTIQPELIINPLKNSRLNACQSQLADLKLLPSMGISSSIVLALF